MKPTSSAVAVVTQHTRQRPNRSSPDSANAPRPLRRAYSGPAQCRRPDSHSGSGRLRGLAAVQPILPNPIHARRSARPRVRSLACPSSITHKPTRDARRLAQRGRAHRRHFPPAPPISPTTPTCPHPPTRPRRRQRIHRASATTFAPVATDFVRLPMAANGASSLNVTVAAGVLVYTRRCGRG